MTFAGGPSRLRRAGFSLAAAALLVACTSGESDDGADAAADEETAVSDESVVDEEVPEIPDGPGPFPVGRTTIEVVEPESDRTLVVDVWYPAAEADGPATEYVFIPGVSAPSLTAQAEPAPADVTVPLVIYSHGSGGISYIASYFTETLASHGFVVAAPNHAGNTAIDLVLNSTSSQFRTALNRPRDVSVVIDAVLERSETADPLLGGLVDGERIGVAGHSFGGFTAYAMAAGFENSFGTVAPDPRVDAVVAMAPASSLLDDARLASIDLPVLSITGTLDDVTPIEPETTRPHELINGSPNVRVDLVGAAHQSFTDVCRYRDVLPSIEAVPPQLIEFVDGYAAQGCEPDQMPIDRAHELSNAYIIAFLQAHVAGDAAFDLLLQPDGDGAIEATDAVITRR